MMSDSSDPMNDDAIDKLLAPLRKVDCSEDVRRANRRAVADACARRAGAPWWHRTVAVPIPLLLAASLALAIAVAASLWPAFGKGTNADTSLRQRDNFAKSDAEIPGWSISRSFILSIESLAKTDAAFHPDATEERNDT